MRKRFNDGLAEIRESLLDSYAVNDRMNHLILEHLDPRAWRAKPEGRNARTIAAIFSHMLDRVAAAVECALQADTAVRVTGNFLAPAVRFVDDGLEFFERKGGLRD